MNNAKMTFRFNEQDREMPRQSMQEPVRRSNPHEISNPSTGNVDYVRADADDEWLTYGHRPDREPDRKIYENADSVPVYQAIDQPEDWGDPFSDYTSTGGMVLPSYASPPPRRTSWWKVAGSLTGAIVTGGLFGAVVLAMFNQELTVPLPGANVPTQASAGEQRDIPVMGLIEEEPAAEEAEGMLVNIALPQQTYHFLQYGVFSSAGGVELAQQELKESGIAAARDTVDEKRVYAGVSSDREQAKLLSSQLKTTGVNLILHEVVLPASVQVHFDGDVTEIERYMAQSAELVGLLSSLSASRLSEVSPKDLSSEEVAELGEKHQLWTESAAAVRGKLSNAFAEGSTVMETAMNSAVEAALEYNKKNAKTLLWEVQDEVMSFILEEYKMMGSGVS